MNVEIIFKNGESMMGKCIWYVRVFIFLIIISSTYGLKAQQISIDGMISESNGKVMPGVSIIVKGTTIGTLSSVDGKYSIRVPDNESILVFSFRGYSTQEIIVGNRREINVIIEEQHQGEGGTGLQSGYKGIVESGFLFGVGAYGMNRFKLDFINAYQINPYFSFGLGIGSRNYYDLNAPVLVPIFADFRVNFIDNLASPYLSFGVGYSFDATNSFESVGFFLNLTVGVSIIIPP